MAISERQLLNSLSRTPFVDSAELALILGEPHATIHRALADLLADAIVGRVSHGTAHLPSSQRYYLTAKGIGEAARVLGFETPSDFVRAYHVSREWLALLIRRMDVVAAVYRLAASLSPGVDGLRSHVEFHRRGRFDSTITLHDGPSFGVVRSQSLALRCRSLYDRLRAIAGYDYTRRPDAVLVLTPSVWELRLTTRFCINLNLDDCFVAVETRDALERRDLRLWRKFSWVDSSYHTLEVDFCVAALEEALSKGRPQIFNTNQGSQFTSEAFTSMLLAQGVQVSMDGRGRCMDNVFVERLWRSIKYEEVYLKAYQNGTEARKGIGAYLAFYNRQRPHQALGYRTPAEVYQHGQEERGAAAEEAGLPSGLVKPSAGVGDSLTLALVLS